MYFIYDEPQPRTPRKSTIPYEDLDANRYWNNHYSNLKYLCFIAEHKESTFEEKQQAGKELVIAYRKMQYWQRHPNWKIDIAKRDKYRCDAMWNSPEYKPSREPKDHLLGRKE